MPKPWPENPLAMCRPGVASTAEMTGIASGVTSMQPAHVCATLAPLSAGNAALTLDISEFNMRGDGAGSKTRSRSNGVTSSGAPGFGAPRLVHEAAPKAEMQLAVLHLQRAQVSNA